MFWTSLIIIWTNERIHWSDGPVSNHHGQEGKGQQWVEHWRHHVTNRSEKRKHVSKRFFNKLYSLKRGGKERSALSQWCWRVRTKGLFSQKQIQSNQSSVNWFFPSLGCSKTSCKYKNEILSPYYVVMVNILANGCLFTNPANTTQNNISSPMNSCFCPHNECKSNIQPHLFWLSAKCWGKHLAL